MSYTVRYADHGELCQWCDGAEPAELAITDQRGWRDVACLWHVRNMFAEVRFPRLRAWLNSPIAW